MKRLILNSSKRTITTAIASVTMAAFMVGGPAFADPDNPEKDTTETQVITETEVNRESVIEVAPTEDSLVTDENPLVMEDDTGDLTAPETESLEDRIIIREKTEVMTETTDVSEEEDALMTEDAETVETENEILPEGDTTLVIEEETDITVTEPDVTDPELTQASVETASYACHIQPTGETECICKDDASCEALTNSDECQPYTEWRDSELGGCTKKAG